MSELKNIEKKLNKKKKKNSSLLLLILDASQYFILTIKKSLYFLIGSGGENSKFQITKKMDKFETKFIKGK